MSGRAKRELSFNAWLPPPTPRGPAAVEAAVNAAGNPKPVSPSPSQRQVTIAAFGVPLGSASGQAKTAPIFRNGQVIGYAVNPRRNEHHEGGRRSKPKPKPKGKALRRRK